MRRAGYGYSSLWLADIINVRRYERVPRDVMIDIKNFLLPNEPTCIVACSGSVARLWRSDSRFGDWRALVEMHHPESTSRESDLASDRPGRAFDSFGSGRHAMAPGKSAHQQELLRFADEVADYINTGIASRKFKKVVLLAEPSFLGHLRNRLSGAAAAAVIMSAPKNLTSLDEAQIRHYFQ